jgi:hypothetical protein
MYSRRIKCTARPNKSRSANSHVCLSAQWNCCKSGRSAHVSQALLIRGVHQSPTKSIARVLSNCSGESTTPCSSIRSITARWDRALYQYQPGSIGVSDVQWVDFTLSCYAMRHLCRLFSSSVVVRCPLCGLAQVSWTLSFRSILTCGGAP